MISDSKQNKIEGEIQPQEKQCTLCEKMIDIAKFRVHEAMCSRMNYKCKECNMIVMKSEKAMHDMEICGKPIEPSSPSDSHMMSPTETKPQEQMGSSLIHEENKFDFQQNSIPPKQEMAPMQKMTSTEMAEANEREIERIMQEQANEMLAQELQAMQNEQDQNRPLTNYEKSKLKTLENKRLYGEDASQWPEGIRPADENKIQSLYDDNNYDSQHQDYEGNVFDQANEFGGIGQIGGHFSNNFPNHNQNPNNLGVMGGQPPLIGPMNRPTVQKSNSAEELKGPQFQEEQLPQIQGDNQFEQSHFQGQSENEQIEEQLLQQILEQSKNEC